MNCVILQPSYIPWRGYFHQIQKADVFVFYDDVQYDEHGWRNRNRVKTPAGTKWLTIPVLSKGCHTNHSTIDSMRINWARKWNVDHWGTLRQSYGKAPFFGRYAAMLEDLYSRHPESLADYTIEFTVLLAEQLGIRHTRFVRSSTLGATGAKTDRLVQVLKAVGATHYISGPSAKSYLEEEKLREAGISLEYMVYDYPEYTQLYPPYDPYVSVLDLLFMVGPEAARYIWQSGAPESAGLRTGSEPAAHAAQSAM